MTTLLLNLIMKKNVDITKLMTINNFAKMKNISRQRIYKTLESNHFDIVEIDGVKFVYLSEKSKNYKKKNSI